MRGENGRREIMEEEGFDRMIGANGKMSERVWFM